MAVAVEEMADGIDGGGGYWDGGDDAVIGLGSSERRVCLCIGMPPRGVM